ncbi:MAG: hypothetical protein ACJAVT_002841 [Yoonia sp.]
MRAPALTDVALSANVRLSGRGSQLFRIAFDPFLSQTIFAPQHEAYNVPLNGVAAALLQKFKQTNTKVKRWSHSHVPTQGGYNAAI